MKNYSQGRGNMYSIRSCFSIRITLDLIALEKRVLLKITSDPVKIFTNFLLVHKYKEFKITFGWHFYSMYILKAQKQRESFHVLELHQCWRLYQMCLLFYCWLLHIDTEWKFTVLILPQKFYSCLNFRKRYISYICKAL